MSRNLNGAITNLVKDLRTITGLQVQTESKERGGRGDMLTVTTGAHIRQPFFGSSKVKQELSMLFESFNPDASYIADMLSEIGRIVFKDLRRGGNAQTTEFTEEWEPEDEEGREGTSLTTTLRIVINAS